MEKFRNVLYNLYTACSIDLNGESSHPLWYNTYLNIITIYKKMSRDFFVKIHEKNYYKSVKESQKITFNFCKVFVESLNIHNTYLVLDWVKKFENTSCDMNKVLNIIMDKFKKFKIEQTYKATRLEI